MEESRSRLVWPEGKRCAVGLSFDFDAETLWFRTLKQADAMPMSRGAYGARVGVPRILQFLKQYALPATFFVPGWTADRYPHLVEQMAKDGHELGHHGYEHEYVVNKPREVEEQILVRGIESLRRITGVVPRGYRAPAGNVGPNTFPLLLQYNFLYDSTLMADELPYWVEVEGVGRLVEVPFAWELTDTPHFLFSYVPYYVGMSSQEKVYEIWAAEFQGAYADGGFYSLVMHPQIMGRRHRMQMLERLVRRMLEKGDVWFATHKQVAEAFAGAAAP